MKKFECRRRSRCVLAISAFVLICVTTGFGAEKSPDMRYCALRWVATGYGAIPPDAVDIDANNGEYVGRARSDNRQWVLGRLSADERGDGLIHLINTPCSGESTPTSSTYQVLTNPHGCLLRWNDNELNPVNAVQLFEDQTAGRKGSALVGRTQFAGIWVAGLVTTGVVDGDNRITFTYNGDTHSRTDIEAQYQILTSVHPKMALRLTDFEFYLNQLAINSNTSRMVIGESRIQASSGDANDDGLRQTIRHERPIEELFTIHGAQFLRCNLERLELDMNLWYGGAKSVHTSFEIPDWSLDSVSMNRTVLVSTSTDVRLDDLSLTRVARLMSTASVFKGSVPFRARAVYTLSMGPKSDHAAKLITACGLRLDKVDSNSGHAYGIVDGVLSGQFILATESSISKL